MAPEVAMPAERLQDEGGGSDPLLHELHQLMSAPDLNQVIAYLQDHLDLLAPGIDTRLGELADRCAAEGRDDIARWLTGWRGLLRQCREEGFVAALDAHGGMVEGPEWLAPFLRRVEELTPIAYEEEDADALTELAEGWLNVAEADEVREHHPALRAAACNNAASAMLRGDGDPAEAIALLHAALDALPPRAPQRPNILLSLAFATAAREPSRLDEAIELVQKAVRDDPGLRGQAGRTLRDIGVRLFRICERDPSLELIDAALAVERRLLDGEYPADGGPGASAAIMVEYLTCRYAISRDEDDLRRSVVAAERAVDCAPEGSMERVSRCNRLAVVLRSVFSATGDADALDRAIQLHEESLEGLPPGQDRVFHLQGLGQARRHRYRSRGDREDLTAAVRAHEEMYELAEPGSHRYDAVLDAYGNTLHERYLAWGDAADLDRAVLVHREEVAATSGRGRVIAVNSLAIDLRHVYASTGDVGALEEAIEALREALTIPAAAEDRDRASAALAGCLFNKYQAFRDAAAGAEAIRILAEVLDRTPRSSRDHAVWAGNLAAALLVQARLTDQPDQARLDQAEELLMEAAAAGVGLERARHLVNLGSCVSLRPGHAESEPSVRRFIAYVEEALDLCPPEAPFAAGTRLNLAGAYLGLHRLTAAPDALARGMELLREGYALGIERSPESLLQASRAWGDHAARNGLWEQAAEAYGYALDSIDRVVGGSPLRAHKQQWLSQVEGLTTAAAAAHVEAGDAWAAVVTLERGRTRLLADALAGAAAENDRLAVDHPELAEPYQRAEARLLELQRQALEPVMGDWLPVAPAFDQARRDRDEALARIREQPGFERFRLPDPAGDIARAMRSGPLLYLLAGTRGGYGVLVDGGSVVAHPLPDLRLDDVLRRLSDYIDAYERAGTDVRLWHRVLDDVTRWLWEAAMGPLLDLVPGDGPLTVVPTWLLVLLPFHAAWTPDQEAPTGRRFAIDRRPLTFAPSAGIAARSAPDGAVAGQMLAVGDPQPVSAGPLPFAAYEVDAAVRAFPDARRLTGDEATREAVLAGLDAHDGHGVLHFACHGYADWEQVLDSYLLLSGDRRLTLRDLLVRPVPAGLVVLSACETALPQVGLSDEVIGLATGFLQGGAAGVIGSMWRVPDASTALLLSRFYAIWKGGGHPAAALRDAQRWVRDATNAELRAAYPALMDHYAPIPEPMRPSWGTGRDFAHPAYWAAFTYTGAA
ncbi:CHAT domain-containing protein [Nonomuraea sp. NPDC049400]|uniref:CHAT domain-containing protein n=1 Tax=Nonomuraea sp. NPDC049400 TaxID=3364352 RepID=UPI00379E1CD7